MWEEHAATQLATNGLKYTIGIGSAAGWSRYYVLSDGSSLVLDYTARGIATNGGNGTLQKTWIESKSVTAVRMASTNAVDNPRRLVLTKGMLFEDAIKSLQDMHATRVSYAYLLPWDSGGPARGSGYHAYYELRDHTCVQLRVRSDTSAETVAGFAVGAKGKPYNGKILWLKDEVEGRVHHSNEISLGD
jgi:hypothetical protein